MIYVRFRGKTCGLNESALNLNKIVGDAQAKERFATYSDVVAEEFNYYAVDRPRGRERVVQPEAVRG